MHRAIGSGCDCGRPARAPDHGGPPLMTSVPHDGAQVAGWSQDPSNAMSAPLLLSQVNPSLAGGSKVLDRAVD